MMLNRNQFKELIESVLVVLGFNSLDAVNLLLGTAAQESRLGTYLKQIGGGPALGVFQMEPATELDIWRNFLEYRPQLTKRVKSASGVEIPGAALYYNLAYQVAMARIHYLRVPLALPAHDNIEGMAKYWKEFYNTHLGKGTEEKFIENYRKMVLR